MKYFSAIEMSFAERFASGGVHKGRKKSGERNSGMLKKLCVPKKLDETDAQSFRLKPRAGVKGQSTVELAVAMIVVVPVVLILIDCAFVAIGAGINDAVCRDAARAAAAGPPGQIEPGAPEKRALSVISRLYASNLPMKVRSVVSIDEKVVDVPSKTTGGSVDGRVVVGTTIDIYPPFTLNVSQRVTLEAKHAVPITFVVQPGP